MIRMVKERNPILVIVLSYCTGIYMLYWIWQTSKELTEELGATLPPLWWIIIPGLNIYYLYLYTEEWHKIFKFEQDQIIVFIACFFFIGLYWIQTELNTKATPAKK